MTKIQQNRVILRAFQALDFPNEKLLSFVAIVNFDGVDIATAHNDGQGGATIIRARKGKGKNLVAARAYAKSFPAQEKPCDPAEHPSGKMRLPVDLPYLVDELAKNKERDKRLRRLFEEEIKRVMFISKGKLQSHKRTRAQESKNLKHVYAGIRARYPDAQVLNELPPEEAYQIWQQDKL